MEYDPNMKRAKFIENSVQIRETFYFANPEKIVSAVHVYAGHWYGAMLWDLYMGRRLARYAGHDQLVLSWPGISPYQPTPTWLRVIL